jgi:hypothetical protein
MGRARKKEGAAVQGPTDLLISALKEPDEFARAVSAIEAELAALRSLETMIATERVGLEPREYETAFAALCDRLKIRPRDHVWVTWALVGMALAKQQPEFKRRGRGRPRLGQFEPNIDYRRAQYLKAMRRKLPVENSNVTDISLIKDAIAARHPLFGIDEERLRQSVARGNQIFKSYLLQWQQMQHELAALKRKAERRAKQAERQRKSHDQQIRRSGVSGLLSGPRSPYNSNRREIPEPGGDCD